MRWFQLLAHKLLTRNGISPGGAGFRSFVRAPAAVVAFLLAIELVDELAFGLREAAWPEIRTDLSLSYVHVGLLLSVPGITSSILEIGIGVLADTGRRKALIVTGGALFGIALIWSALSPSVWVLLGAFILFYPASGAFVALSQASLMDSDPSRHEQNMARWTFAGSLGVVGGSLLFAGGALAGVSWRWLFAAVAVAALALTVVMARAPLPESRPHRSADRESFMSALASAAKAMKQKAVFRWLILLQFSDLMLDVLLGFIALYFVDVVGATPAQAALAVTVWTVVGLAGDFALIPLLERVRGTDYLKVSAALTAVVFAGFLLAPGLWPKLALLGALGLLNAGWYSVLQAQVYTAMPGRSGAVVSVTSAAGIAGGALPLAIGAFAGMAGLQAAMWLLLVSPLAMVAGLLWTRDAPSTVDMAANTPD